MRTLLGAVLIVAGLLACGFGILVWVSISRSDTATGALVLFGLSFALPGAASAAAGAWLLRRRPPPG